MLEYGMPTADFDLNDYEVVDPASHLIASNLVKIWEGLGKPTDPFTDAGAKLLDAIIAAWEYKFTSEAHEWHENRKDYQLSELSISEQVSQKTGRSLASYPYFIYQAMRKFFPEFKPGERESCIKLVGKWPMFRMANRI